MSSPSSLAPMKALDLFCGAGGATKGLQRAGFHVTGVDIRPQPRYCGDAFVQADAMSFPLAGYDFIWASPPCQGYSVGTGFGDRRKPPRLIGAMRERLAGYSCVIENVMGARREMINPVMLCGAMFQLGVVRHRLFECSFPLHAPPHKCHGPEVDRDLVSVTAHGPPPRWYRKNPGAKFRVKIWHDAMGISWMTRNELREAIPPAYSEYIACAFLAAFRPSA